jgi:nucleoside-diphosphate-sugar epimerase
VSSAAEERFAVLTGARGLVGRRLLPLLLERGVEVRAVSRAPAPEGPSVGVHWVGLDLSRPPEAKDAAAIGPARLAFHAAPIWLLPAWISALADAGVRRLVAFSSTSRFTKERSRSRAERDTARRIAEAEERLASSCRERGVHWTILRPTLVWDGEHDRNVSDVARFVRRFGFFPVAGDGLGRRQPVHAADLAAAALAVLDAPATLDRAYDTPGGETLTYLEMVERIARGTGREPRLVRMPLPLLRGALRLATRLPGLGHLSPDMADRMGEDLVFDVTEARRDFGYDPRAFRFPGAPDPQADP